MDEHKNAARNAITELDTIPDNQLDVNTGVMKFGLLAIAKVLWLIAMILLEINNKMKK